MKKTLKKAFSLLLILAIFLSLVFSLPVVAHASAENQLHNAGLIPDSIETIQAYSKEENLPSLRASSVDLTSSFPSPGNQGSQESCVGWAVGYALKSHQEKIRYNWNIGANSHRFSPAYIYNQINGGSDNGAKISSAMSLAVNNGFCSLVYFPYTASNYTTQPTTIQNAAAALYKAKSWHTVFGVTSIKNRLATGDGVVVGIRIYPDLDNLNASNQIYDNANGSSRGNHAICLIGYDDSKGSSGAFKFINSWGTSWGEGGYGWISYDLIQNISVNIYGTAVGYVLNDRTSDNYVMGDLDGDGKVTAADSRLALRFSAKLETPTATQYALADVDGDSQVTAADSRSILQFSARTITKFPLYE